MVFPRKPLFWAVSLGHMMNDIFMSMGAVLIAFLSTSFVPMSTAEIGLVISLRTLAGAISQPFFGNLADRGGGRIIGAGGVGWTVGLLSLSLMLAATTGNFWLMAIPFVTSALGSGAFHPVGVMYASEVEPENANRNTAYFFLFGQLGLALGPTFAGVILDDAATSASLATFIPIFLVAMLGIIPVAFMSNSIPNATAHKTKAEASLVPRDTRPVMEQLRGMYSIPMLVMSLVILARAVAMLGTIAFIPKLFELNGWTPAQYGSITSVYWIGSALMGVILGRIADRYDSRYVVAVSLTLGAPALFLLPGADGLIAYVLAIMSGAFLGGINSIMIIISQRIIPVGKGFASGLILGYFFVCGAVGTFFLGLLADGVGGLPGIGLAASFQVASAFAVIAAVLVITLPAWVATNDPLPEKAKIAEAPASGD